MVMRKMFKKGDLVRNIVDGKVMEVLKYMKKNLVEVKWFDLRSKEVHTDKVRADRLSKAV